VGVFWLPVEAGARTCSEFGDLHRWYGEADAVALVKIVGERWRRSGETSDADAEAAVRLDLPLYDLEVVQSWKRDIPKSLTLPANQLMSTDTDILPRRVYPKVGQEELLLLDKSGKFRPALSICSYRNLGNVDLVQWLDRVTACGCKIFDAQGFHDAADLVVLARTAGVTKKETKTFAEIDASVLWSRFEHESSKMRLTVLMEDGRRKDCGYPAGQQGKPSLLYLRRDQENGYSTDVCSGNLSYGQKGFDPRLAFEWRQPRPSIKKTGTQGKCACEKLDVLELYDRADAVVRANVKRIIGKGAARFVDLVNVVNLKKGELLSEPLRIYTGDVDSECRYPVYGEGEGYIFYLHRDKDGRFSTDYCSGNLGPRDGVDLRSCGHWLQKQSFPAFDVPVQDDACSKR
jgi:hypothetical protein